MYSNHANCLRVRIMMMSFRETYWSMLVKFVMACMYGNVTRKKKHLTLLVPKQLPDSLIKS